MEVVERVRVLKCLKTRIGKDKHVYNVGQILTSEHAPIPEDIIAELRANTGAVERLGAVEVTNTPQPPDIPEEEPVVDKEPEKTQEQIELEEAEIQEKILAEQQAKEAADNISEGEPLSEDGESEKLTTEKPKAKETKPVTRRRARKVV